MVRTNPLRPVVFGPDLPDGCAGLRLQDGRIALIDIENAARFSDFNWHAARGSLVLRTARLNGMCFKVWLHKEVLGVGRDTLVDHINGDALDNRAANLRIATPQQNSWNRRKNSVARPYKGVSPEPSAPHLWRAEIGIDGAKRHLGSFDTAEDAARAYDFAAVAAFGEFSRLNFPGEALVKPAAHVAQVARGERLPHSRFTEEDVRDIRKKHVAGATMRRLAKDYGVSFGAIHGIITRRTWRHVAEAA
jgi:hypothetical protein